MPNVPAVGTVGGVVFGVRRVFAYFEAAAPAGGWRVRLGLDEFDGLGLHPFQWVRVRFPGRGDEVVFFAGVRELPPFVWMDLRPRP